MQQHITLEAASQQPFRRLDLQQQPDPEAIHDQKATRPSQYQLDALIPEQSYIQRLTQSIQIDRELLYQSCQQLAQLPPEYQPCMLMLQLQHHILLHDPDFAHMLIHAQDTLSSHNQPVLILEFDAKALLRQHDQALKRLALLRQCGVLIALRNAQPSAELKALLQATSVSLLSFTDQFNADLVHPTHAPTRLQQLQDLRKISNFKILIKNINQQDSFERAATLDVDFLQGDYFQAKQEKLTLTEQIQHS